MAELTEETPEALVSKIFKDVGPVITRQEIGKRAKGIISPRSLANLDSRGLGIPGGFLLNRRRMYPTENVVRWFTDRIGQ